MASVGSIVGGAFRLIRERPGSIAIWALTYFLVGSAIGLGLVFAFTGGLSFGNPAAFGNPPQFSGGLVLGIVLVYLGYLLLAMVLMNAVFRSVLRPSESAFASMRLGMDEIRMLGLLILWVIANIIGIGLCELLLLLVAGVFGVMLQGSPGAMIGVTILLFLGFFCALIWAQVRLSLLFPVTFHRRRIAIDEAWSLTRGRFWTLFGSYLIVWVITMVVFVALFWMTMGGSYFAMMSQMRSNPEQAQEAMQAFTAAQAQVPLAVRLGMSVVWAALSAVMLALWCGTQASATRELLLEEGEVLEDDAESTAAIFE